MSLPPGATLVSGSLPDTSQLPPGATLVSGSLPTFDSGASTEGTGFWAHVGKSLRSMAPEDVPSFTDTLKQAGISSLGPGYNAIQALHNAATEYLAARQRGHGIPYSAAAGASSTVGVSPERMEQAANAGDTAGVLGEAAVPTAMAVAPLGAEGISKTGVPSAVKGTIADIKPDLVSHLQKTHSLSGQAAAYLAEKLLPDSAASIQAAEEAAKTKFENAQQRTDAIFQKAKKDAAEKVTAQSSQEAEEAAKSKTAQQKADLLFEQAKANAAKEAAKPAAPFPSALGPETPTARQLRTIQSGNLAQLVGERPSGVTVVPEPRALFPGETPNYMASVPRATLQDLALAGKPGAAKHVQQLGGQVIYAPSGLGISNIKSAVALRDLLSAPDFTSRATLNPIGETGARPIVTPESQFESSFGPEHQEVGDLAEWETGNREGVRVGSDLDKAAKSIFGGKSFDSLTQAQKAHILRIAQTQVAVP
jgi:hypothetical protein